MTQWIINPGQMTLAQLRDVYGNSVCVSVPNSANSDIEAATDCVRRVLDENRTAYGINTGFGLLAQTRIEKNQVTIQLSRK